MYAFGDELTVTGLKLAGLKNSYAVDATQINDALQDTNEARIILITHSLAKHAEEKIMELRDKGKIVVEIPDQAGGGDEINRLIQSTIGVELKK